MTRIRLDLTPEQAQVVAAALDLLARLGLGQLEQVADLVANGQVPLSRASTEDKALPEAATSQAVAALLQAAKSALDFHPTASRGISHPHNHPSTHRAWEIRQVLERAIRDALNPDRASDPAVRDPVLLRYTQDPAPVAVVHHEHHVPDPQR